MCAVGVTCKLTLGAFARVFASEWKHITAVTTPVGANVRKGLESMGNAMVNFFFVFLQKDGQGPYYQLVRNARLYSIWICIW